MAEQDMGRREWLILGALIAILFVAQAYVTYRFLVLPNPGANDYYSRWAGARALLIDGRNPYDLAVTREIQDVIQIDHAEVGRGGFHYPLHVTFLFWPLIYVPYVWAQAIWQTILVWVTIGIVAVMMLRLHWRPSPPGMVGLLLAGIMFYPAARSVLLGQFTLHVTLFLALSLLMWQRGHDGWAGIFLAATSVKPQMVILIGVWLLLWAIRQRRWRFIGGVLGGGLAFLLMAMLLYPPWPLRFWEDTFRYSAVAGGNIPLAVFFEWLLPAYADIARTAVSAVLIIIMLYTWWRAWRSHDENAFLLALFWTIVVSVLVTFQTGTTNQAIFLIPLFIWLYQGLQRWGVWPMTAVTALLLFCLWWLFLATISGDYENPLLFFPMPFFILAILVVIELKGGWHLESAPTSHP